MRALLDVTPTPEQLALFSRIRTGVEVIRGAAGSGKTTTALLKLRAAAGSYVNRRRRMKTTEPVRILVLTFNRTLKGYVAELANRQIESSEEIVLQIDTFSNWAKALLGNPKMMDAEVATTILRAAATALPLPSDFVVDEARYVLERFMPDKLEDYLTTRREGRGTTPRMEKNAREILLSQVIKPYMQRKINSGQNDWNDLAIRLAAEKHANYDIVIVDETQDFSANEVRAVLNQLSKDHTITFVMDSAQRIYPRSFSWQEVGVTLRPENSHRLATNYRNTRQLAHFAASILAGMTLDDDASLPDFSTATRDGEIPRVLIGRFNSQVADAIKKIKISIDLSTESVAFLHAKGGGWFNGLKAELDAADLDYVSISRKAEWPAGSENIALSTLHSAKGLEFDHVFILGLNAEVVPVLSANGATDEERLNAVRRLVAMGVGRARKSVTVGYLPSDAPEVANFFDASVCTKVVV